jgi:hypothetical protein
MGAKMADIMKDNVEIYVRELISKEFDASSNNKENAIWDKRKQREMIWATKEKEIMTAQFLCACSRP